MKLNVLYVTEVQFCGETFSNLYLARSMSQNVYFNAKYRIHFSCLVNNLDFLSISVNLNSFVCSVSPDLDNLNVLTCKRLFNGLSYVYQLSNYTISINQN